MNVAVRKALWSQGAAPRPVGGWSDELRWYAAGIHQMKLLTPGLDDARPVALRANFLLGRRPRTAAQTNELIGHLGTLKGIIQQWSSPLSLGYQSQVHATFLFDDADWPSFRGTRVLWEECAHGNWFFLPWHRAYLAEFETIVRAHIKKLGGPHKLWALPCWNSTDYRTIPDAATLPAALTDRLVPPGIDIPGLVENDHHERINPLFEPSRRGPGPLGPNPSIADWADASEALLRAHYANAEATNLVSFAGGYLEDLAQFHSSNELGQIDLQPHGGGHIAVGGLMASFTTAGLDPVFWMHHANVDRLWETYAHDLGHGYPFPAGRPAGALAREAFDSWSEREFRFLRANGRVKAWTAPQVLDVEALGYRYATTAPPVFSPVPAPPAGADIDPFGLDQGDFTPIAASSAVALAGTTTVELTGGDGDAASAAQGQRWAIRMDGIRSELPAQTSYALYLGDDADPAEPSRQPAGNLTLFGVFESSLETNGDRGSSRVFDVTAVVQELTDFNPLSARVTLVPADEDRDLESIGLTIERISLEVG